MRKALLFLVAISLLWTFQATENPASAHGGSYRGPAGEVPPGQRDPKDPQPPPEAGTPTGPQGPGTGTPPPEGPGTGGDDGGSPPPDSPKPPAANPAGPVGPAGPGGSLTGQGKRAQPKPMSFENWLFWWAYNKDEILNIKAAVKNMQKKVATSSSPFFLGGGENEAGTQAPTQRKINEEIVPALEAVVSNTEIHPDIRGGALIALSRCRDSDHLETFFDLAKRDNGEDKLVQESAILALGIGQKKGPEVRDYLLGIVNDPEYPFRGRCFAMLALGLLQDNSPEVYEGLLARLDGRESHQDVPVCAILTIGLIGDNKMVPQLTQWLDSGKIGRMKLSDMERAWVIGALGKIGDPAALKPISDQLRKKGLYCQRSAMIAMGQLLPQAEPKDQVDFALKLARVIENESDITAKNFGVIALGRIGGSETADESVRDACLKVLKKAFKDGNKVTERPFAALALGLVGFESNGVAKPKEMRYEIAEMIRRELADLKGDKIALGAQAIALGMLGDSRSETVDLLCSILKDRGQEKKLRGSAAMSLGLIGAPAAKEAIMTALQEREDRDLRVDTAVAAGLLGDSAAITELVNVLSDPKASQFVLGSVALALGQIGDHNAISPLVQILEPEKANGAYPDLTRALVAVALGQIADQSDIRVLSRLSKDINYRASVPALDEILTIL
jgi:HEAT repeat protein